MGNNLTRYAMTERNVLTIADHPFIVKLFFLIPLDTFHEFNKLILKCFNFGFIYENFL